LISFDFIAQLIWQRKEIGKGISNVIESDEGTAEQLHELLLSGPWKLLFELEGAVQYFGSCSGHIFFLDAEEIGEDGYAVLSALMQATKNIGGELDSLVMGSHFDGLFPTVSHTLEDLPNRPWLKSACTFLVSEVMTFLADRLKLRCEDRVFVMISLMPCFRWGANLISSGSWLASKRYRASSNPMTARTC
jgi:hypothetical protein